MLLKSTKKIIIPSGKNAKDFTSENFSFCYLNFIKERKINYFFHLSIFYWLKMYLPVYRLLPIIIQCRFVKAESLLINSVGHRPVVFGRL